MIDTLDCAGKLLDLSVPQVMGVLNVTPDSFSDGGLFVSKENAMQQGRRMIEQGAALIDVGGESTRPGAAPVSLDEELDRVIPIVEALHKEMPAIISIDTSKPQVMLEAVKAGAGMINDVCALSNPGALAAAVQANIPVCLMHMQGKPRSMQDNPQYEDVVTDVKAYLNERVTACIDAGIKTEHLIIDPGFGFGKSVDHNLTLVNRLAELQDFDLPLLVGFSRKSTIGALLNKPVEQRLAGSIAMAVIACWLGATIFRVHDVEATVDALRVCNAIKKIES